MSRQVVFVLISTFCIGFFAGIFVFFESRSNDVREDETSHAPETGFEIIGYTYGGCERVGCASYRIDDTGAYSYIAMDRMAGDGRYEDVLTEKQQHDLAERIASFDPEMLKAKPFTGTCPVTYDGLGYRYEIRIGGEWFSFDSCKEDMDGDTLFVLLSDYFEIFRVLHGATS